MNWDNMINSIPEDDGVKPVIATVDGKPLSSPARRIDADTTAVGKDTYRLEGMNAPETGKFRGSVFVPGDVAGDRTEANVRKVAELGGYTDLVNTGKKDRNGRIIGRQSDTAGNSLGDTVTALGLTEATPFSSLPALKTQGTLKALARMLPVTADSDPMIRLAQEEMKQRKVEGEVSGSGYVPKPVMENEAQYAAAKNMVGHKAVQENVAELERLDGILRDPDLSPETRVRLTKLRDEARDNIFYGATTPDFAGPVSIRKGDRTIMNQAYSQFGTTLNRATLDMRRQLGGYAQMVGESNQWEWLAQKGREEVLQAKTAQGNLADTLNSFREIDTGNGSWNAIKDTATYVSNLAAGTLPLLAVMAGSAMAAGAAIPTAGVALAASSLPSAVLYSGGFYADQPEDKKNPGLALAAGIGSAVLDRVGLEGMLGNIGGNLFSQIGFKQATEALVQKGMTAEAAKELLEGASKKTIMEVTGFSAGFAERHYASKEAGLAAMRSVGLAGGVEAGTESAQQLLEMFAQTGEFNTDLRYEKQFYDGLIDAAVGGSVMGGTIHVGGVGLDAASWGSIANAKAAFEGKLNDAQSFQAQQKRLADEGVGDGDPRGVRSVLDALSKVNNVVETGLTPELNDLPGNPGRWNGFLSVLKDPVRMLRGLGDTAVRSLRKDNGELRFYLPILKSLMSPGILPGDTYDGFKQRIMAAWTTPDRDTLSTELGVPTSMTDKLLREAWQRSWSRGENLAPTTKQDAILQEWKDRVDSVSEQAKQLLTESGYDTATLGNVDSVFVDALINPKTVSENETGIVDSLVRGGATTRVARQTVTDLLSGNPTDIQTAKSNLVRYGVFTDPTLNHVFEPNIMDAFENHKHLVASRAASEVYLGKNGANLAKLLHKAHQAGEFRNDAEYADTVQSVRDWYKITQGTYNSLEAYPAIEKILGWGVTVMMLASLGKAALSSIPEMAMATMGNGGKDVFKQLGINIAELKRELSSEVNKGISFTTSRVGMAYARNTPNGRAQKELAKLTAEHESFDENTSAEKREEHAKKVKQFHKKYMGRSLFERLGYNETGFNAQTRFETNTANMKRTMQVFASVIGLNAMTNATRIATLSMASDVLSGRLTELLAIPVSERSAAINTGAGLTNEQFQSLREMQSWGMDVEKVLFLLSNYDLGSKEGIDLAIGDVATGDNTRREGDSDLQQLRDELTRSITNMVDQRVVNPQTSNLPKYYHDPKLKIFTTMTRFVAAATATVLPRLYRDFIKNGTTGMRYQAFSTMALAMLFAMTAGMLKDMLSYGDDENPYLKTNAKLAQRALYGSGLLGRLDSAVDVVAPLYANKKADPSKAPVTYGYQSLRDMAPPISWADRAVRAMYDFGQGDVEAGVKKTVKSLPLVGSFPVAATAAANLVK